MNGKIQAFVICWEGFESRADAIAKEIIEHVDAVTVVYSNTDNLSFTGAGRWIMVPNDWLYGKKFVECQKYFNGDIHLQIQADASSDDWPGVIRSCKQAFSDLTNLGVWAPNVDYSPWRTTFVAVWSIRYSQAQQVIQTDGITWAFNAKIDQELRSFKIGENNSGWGIDQLAICIALRFAQLVIRDLAVTVHHPKSTGYNKAGAMEDKVGLTQQFGYIDRTSYRIIVYTAKWRKALSEAVGWPGFVLRILDWALVVAFRFWSASLALISRRSR